MVLLVVGLVVGVSTVRARFLSMVSGCRGCCHQMAAMVFTTNAAMSWSGELHGERRGVVVAGGDGRDGMWLNDLINCAQQGGVQLTGQGGCRPR